MTTGIVSGASIIDSIAGLGKPTGSKTVGIWVWWMCWFREKLTYAWDQWYGNGEAVFLTCGYHMAESLFNRRVLETEICSWRLTRRVCLFEPGSVRGKDPKHSRGRQRTPSEYNCPYKERSMPDICGVSSAHGQVGLRTGKGSSFVYTLRTVLCRLGFFWVFWCQDTKWRLGWNSGTSCPIFGEKIRQLSLMDTLFLVIFMKDNSIHDVVLWPSWLLFAHFQCDQSGETSKGFIGNK